MQRAPGEDRLFRVPYGDGELEFMAQPWFDVDVAALRTTPVAGRYDIVIAGIGRPEDSDLGRASQGATRVWSAALVRDGGAIVLVAQLDEGEGIMTDEHGARLALALAHCLVVVAASEAPEIVRLAKMRAAVDVEEALDIAYEHIGRPTRASVLLVPRALHTLPVIEAPAPTR